MFNWLRTQVFTRDPRHIWRRYAVAAFFIVLSVLVSNLAPKSSLNTVEASAEIIDTAGRQRMLSQRILFLTTLAASDAGSSQASHEALKRATAEFENAQFRLSRLRTLRLEASPNEEQSKLNQSLDGRVERFVALAKKIEADLEPGQRQNLLNEMILLGSTRLLSDLDAAVQRDEEYTLKKVQRVKTIANVTLAFALTMVLLEIFFIFLPAHRTIIKFLEDRKQFESTLLEKTQELEDFTYLASHDLRAPLRGMENLVTWIDNDLPEEMGEETRSHLDLLRKRISRMNELLSDMLAFAKIGKASPEVTIFDLRPAMEEVLTWVDIPEGFTVNIDPKMPKVTASRSVVQQIWLNLLKNAIKHHDKTSGQVDVTYSVKDNHHVFIVADDGPGIPDEYREYIFKPFQRLASRDVVEGSGIGLSITRKLVTSLNGKIELLDPKEGMTRGACFRVKIPIREPNEAF